MPVTAAPSTPLIGFGQVRHTRLRPRRPADRLAKFPAATERVFKPEGCPPAG